MTDASCLQGDHAQGYSTMLSHHSSNHDQTTQSITMPSDDAQAYQNALHLSVPPADNNSTLSLVDPTEDLKLGTFMTRERWLDHLAGLMPLDIQDMVRATVDADDMLRKLCKYTVNYLESITNVIDKHASYGIMKLFAEIRP